MDIRLKTALHYVWLAEQPGWGPYARAEVARMDSEMELFRGLRELCNRVRAKDPSLELTQEPTPGWPSIGTGN